MKYPRFLLHFAALSLLLCIQSPEIARAKVSVPQGIYEISSALNDDFVLDIRHCTLTETDSQTAQLFYPLNVNQQKFYLDSLFGNVYHINALHTGEALSFQDQEEDSPALCTVPPSEEEGVTDDPNQYWILQQADEDTYYIRSRSGKYVTLEGSCVYLGASVVLSDFSGQKNQQWTLKESRISPEDTADTDAFNPYEEGGQYQNLQVTIRIGEELKTITSQDFASWTTETEDHEFILDTQKLYDYAEALAESYNTYGHPRKFVTTGGSEITLSKGTYGWKMDIDETVAQLQKASERTGRIIIEPAWSQKGAVLERGNDIGDSYVEVSLMDQKVWLYIDGKQILETDCVSGTYGTDRQTPGGVYFIYYRQSPAVLRGADYESPVQYWMAYNGGIGLHDANWRGSFGGNIFRSNGSHGCVNLPTDAAKTIYEMTSKGFPVVSYN